MSNWYCNLRKNKIKFQCEGIMTDVLKRNIKGCKIYYKIEKFYKSSKISTFFI